MLKTGILTIVVLLMAHPLTGYEGTIPGFDPGMKAETEQACEVMHTEYQAFMQALTKKSRRCMADVRPDEMSGAGLSKSCGPCCRYKTQTFQMKEGGFDHPCTFPKRCAADREREYCPIALWEKRLVQCRDQYPAFDYQKAFGNWKLSAALMGRVEQMKIGALLEAIKERIEDDHKDIRPEAAPLPGSALL